MDKIKIGRNVDYGERKEGILWKKKRKKQELPEFFAAKWSYLLGMAALIYIDVLQTEVPIIVGGVIDGIKAGIFVESTVWGQVSRMLFIAAAVFIGRNIWRHCIFGASRKIERDMRNDLYAHLQTMPASYFQEHKAGEMMAYMTNDIEAVRMVFAVTVMMGLDCLTIGLSTIYKMLRHIDIGLTLMAVIPMFLVAVVTLVMGREMHRRFRLRQEAFSDLSDFTQEKLNGIKVIKAFVQEQKELAAFEKVNNKSKEANIRQAKLEAFMFPFMRAIAGICVALAIGYGGYIAILGRISVGQFSAFIAYLNMLIWPIASIGRIINVITRGSASMARIEAVMQAKPDIVDAPGVPELEKLDGEIVVKDLTFRYPGDQHDTLKNVSVTVKKGETLGIVGRTGSGKTTLVNLMLRIFDPEEGRVFVGGKEIHEVSLKSLRKTFGYVPQDNYLFSDTIAGNITFGDRSKTQEDVERAAKMACVHDNIVEFHQGYQTLVGERGVSLSGGQKQRVSIARALILDPEILVMDDSVSAVDTDTEEKILGHLREGRKGKTNIIIAHRISTLQGADHIIVLDEGRIAEEGNHESLLEKGGIYADMYQQQLLEKMKREEYAL